MKIKKTTRGYLYINKHDPKTIEELNNLHPRVGRKLMWYPISIQHHVEDLKHHFKNQDVYLIGKGPSINDFPKLVLPNPIVCINDAVNFIQTKDNMVFSIQQDVSVHLDYSGENYTPIVSAKKATTLKDLSNVYVYDPYKYHALTSSVTAICAINILQSFGIKSLKLYGFDSFFGLSDYAPQFKKKKSTVLKSCEQIKKILKVPTYAYNFIQELRIDTSSDISLPQVDICKEDPKSYMCRYPSDEEANDI